jgi:hypothetical protein
MSSPEKQSSLEEALSPIAWKNLGLVVSYVTPSPKKMAMGVVTDSLKPNLCIAPVERGHSNLAL